MEPHHLPDGNLNPDNLFLYGLKKACSEEVFLEASGKEADDVEGQDVFQELLTHMPEQALTVGRMVYYKARGSADGKFPKTDRAAVVTDVRTVQPGAPDAQGVSEPVKTQARLCVFNPEGIFFSDWLDQGQEGGQWDWMPFQKDQQARMAVGGAALGGVAIGKMPEKAV